MRRLINLPKDPRIRAFRCSHPVSLVPQLTSFTTNIRLPLYEVGT